MAAARPLTLVGASHPTAQAQFATRLLHCVQESGDIASEACWQQLGRLLAQDWPVFAADQEPKDTWTMLTTCTTVVLKIRRAAKQGQGQTGEQALEEFRKFMGEVLGDDKSGR